MLGDGVVAADPRRTRLRRGRRRHDRSGRREHAMMTVPGYTPTAEDLATHPWAPIHSEPWARWCR